MNRTIELLAPGGDAESIKTAILAGADAVFCGLNKFNARNRAANISFEQLQGIIRLAHEHDCEIFLTLNILILDCEIPALIKLLNKLVNTRIDGIIVQDFGLFYLLSKHFRSLRVHASTQLTTHNTGQIEFLGKLGAERVNLSRELTMSEIESLTAKAHQNNMLTEVFVHGSYCISFSGICYMSSVHGGNSGNRGRCSQPCRDKYIRTGAGYEYPLNLKDNSAYFDFETLYKAGVDSLKIEGRIKEFEYVYTVVDTWRKQIDQFLNTGSLVNDNRELYKVFNRDFSNAFLQDNISKDMFIDNPMSNSTKHLSTINSQPAEQDEQKLYREKEILRKDIKTQIDKYSIAKLPIAISITGAEGAPLSISVTGTGISFEIQSEVALSGSGTEALNEKMILKRLKAINETEYEINQLELSLDSELYLPFKELTALKKRLLYILNGNKALTPPVTLPKLPKQTFNETQPQLSVLISAIEDAYLCDDPALSVYFQLPDHFANDYSVYLELFQQNQKLIPWFPQVLIGKDYEAATDLLFHLAPETIVANNTGIALYSYKRGIPWIAGPGMNITNSYSLICLQEYFGCSGAFLSNELSQEQIRAIKKPGQFSLHYCIYQPTVLMTSRTCLFHTVTGCEKHKYDNTCVSACEKHSSIKNINGKSFYIQKTQGNYHRVYDSKHMLNNVIHTDLPGRFSNFLIDLSNVKTDTHSNLDKTQLVKLFKQQLTNDKEASAQLNQEIQAVQNSQYHKGI